MVGSEFQSLGAAQLNDLSARVFLDIIFGKVNKAAESSLRLTPNGDKHLISTGHITPQSHIKVTRKKE